MILTILDIKARDQAGRILHVEVRILLPRHFSARVLYYCASGYRQQPGEGDPYSRLRPTITICLLKEKLFPDSDEVRLVHMRSDSDFGIRP